MNKIGDDICAKISIKSAGNFILDQISGKIIEVINTSTGPIYKVAFNNGNFVDWVNDKFFIMSNS